MSTSFEIFSLTPKSILFDFYSLCMRQCIDKHIPIKQHNFNTSNIPNCLLRHDTCSKTQYIWTCIEKFKQTIFKSGRTSKYVLQTCY